MTDIPRLCAEIEQALQEGAPYERELLRSALAALQAITAERDAAQQLMAEEWPRMVQRAEQAEAALKSPR